MYTIGISFGTLSGRARLVDARNGSEIATAVFDYPLWRQKSLIRSQFFG